MLPRPSHVLFAITAALLVNPLVNAALSQDSTDAGATTLTAIYSDGQAKKGEKTFAKHCAACHETFFFTGARFDDVWAGHSAFDLWDRIQSSMPQDKPGSLSKQQYSEVVAYILRLNGYPPGKEALPTEPEALKNVMIDAKRSP